MKYNGKNWKGGKWEKHTLGQGLWQENEKRGKWENNHSLEN